MMEPSRSSALILAMVMAGAFASARTDSVDAVGLASAGGTPEPQVSTMREGATMIAWSKDELRRIAEADDLHISPFRKDREM